MNKNHKAVKTLISGDQMARGKKLGKHGKDLLGFAIKILQNVRPHFPEVNFSARATS